MVQMHVSTKHMCRRSFSYVINREYSKKMLDTLQEYDEFILVLVLD